MRINNITIKDFNLDKGEISISQKSENSKGFIVLEIKPFRERLSNQPLSVYEAIAIRLLQDGKLLNNVEEKDYIVKAMIGYNGENKEFLLICKKVNGDRFVVEEGMEYIRDFIKNYVLSPMNDYIEFHNTMEMYYDINTKVTGK